MEEFFVYILYSEKYDKFYIGQTNNLQERLWKHNNLETDSFTSKFRPWEIVASFQFETREKALKAEKFVKRQKSRKFIQKLIDNQQNTELISQIFSYC